MKTSPLMAAAASLLASAALAQTVATGAGREDEMSESARIDAYLGAAASTPADGAANRLSPAESAASAGALSRPGPLPPMAADSPWSRGVVGPTDGPLTLAGADGAPVPCDHQVHGEAGAEIGTRGERGGYGVATIPVGKDCSTRVTVGVGTQRGPRWRGGDGEVNSGSVRIDSPGFSLGLSGVSGSGRGPAF